MVTAGRFLASDCPEHEGKINKSDLLSSAPPAHERQKRTTDKLGLVHLTKIVHNQSGRCDQDQQKSIDLFVCEWRGGEGGYRDINVEQMTR